MRRVLSLLLLCWTMGSAGGFEKGEGIFRAHCSSCHGPHLPVEQIRKNFFEANNTLLNLKAPTVNMLAWAIMEGPKKIGDPEDPEMRQAEIEEYLKEMLTHPDRDNSICDSTVMRYYETKKPLEKPLSDEQYAALARYFMEYKERNLHRNTGAGIVKKLEEFADEGQILQEAQRMGKRIVIEAETEHCHYCRRMKREVIDSPEVRKALQEGFILVSVDVEKSKLPFGLGRVYQKITPSFFFLDEKGHLINHYPGSWKKGDFLKILDENRPGKKERE